MPNGYDDGSKYTDFKVSCCNSIQIYHANHNFVPVKCGLHWHTTYRNGRHVCRVLCSCCRNRGHISLLCLICTPYSVYRFVFGPKSELLDSVGAMSLKIPNCWIRCLVKAITQRKKRMWRLSVIVWNCNLWARIHLNCAMHARSPQCSVVHRVECHAERFTTLKDYHRRSQFPTYHWVC